MTYEQIYRFAFDEMNKAYDAGKNRSYIVGMIFGILNSFESIGELTSGDVQDLACKLFEYVL